MERKDLLDILDKVKPALSTKPLIPIFQTFCFTGETVYAYNDVLGIIAPCEVDLKIGIPGDTLLGLLSNSRGKNITFEIDEKKNETIVKTGGSKIKLPYFEETEFLFEEPEDDWETVLDLDDEVLDAFSCCLITVSEDTTQQAFMGVTIFNDSKNHEFCFYSCDGDCLTRYIVLTADKATIDKDKGGRTYIVPTEFCQAVLRLITMLGLETEEGEPLGTLSINDDWACADFETGHKIYGRIIEKDKPTDFEKMFDDSFPESANFIDIPKDIALALTRATVVVDRNTLRTQLTMEGKKLKLYTESSTGTIRDSLKLNDDYEETDVYVNAALVERAVGLCDQFAVCETCTAYKKEDYLLQIIGNLGLD